MGGAETTKNTTQRGGGAVQSEGGIFDGEGAAEATDRPCVRHTLSPFGVWVPRLDVLRARKNLRVAAYFLKLSLRVLTDGRPCKYTQKFESRGVLLEVEFTCLTDGRPCKYLTANQTDKKKALHTPRTLIHKWHEAPVI